MYEDLLAIPSRTQSHRNTAVDLEAQKLADKAALRCAVRSLYALEGSLDVAADMKSQYMAAISKLREVVETLESAQGGSGSLPAPVSILAPEEWISLIRVCAEEQDGPAAEAAVDLMKVSRAKFAGPLVLADVVAALWRLCSRSCAENSGVSVCKHRRRREHRTFSCDLHRPFPSRASTRYPHQSTYTCRRTYRVSNPCPIPPS